MNSYRFNCIHLVYMSASACLILALILRYANYHIQGYDLFVNVQESS